MKTLLTTGLLMACTLFASAQTTEIEDVDVKNSLTFKGKTVTLNGGGVREKFWLDMYVGALYLTNKTSDAAAVMATDEPMNIRLHIVSSLITSEKMTSAVDEGFDNSAPDNRSALEDRIVAFKDAFSEEIEDGDIFDIAWVPGVGTVIYKNDKELKTIKGLDFKKALYGIWFCDEPADEDLKDGMLGL